MTTATAEPEAIAEVIPPPPEPKPWEAIPDGEFGIVELFGHTTLVGRIAEVEQFGCKMLAIQPLFNGTELAAVLHGGAAIYRLTRCSRQIAWERQPRSEYNLPASIRAIIPQAALPNPLAGADIEVGREHDDEERD